MLKILMPYEQKFVRGEVVEDVAYFFGNDPWLEFIMPMYVPNPRSGEG